MKRATLCKPGDQVGKVFQVEQGMRRCMVCEERFGREEAPEHAGMLCFAKTQSQTLPNGQKENECR